MLRERQKSGLFVKEWCLEQRISEHSAYYRLRRISPAACAVMEQAQPLQLAGVPLAPKQEENHAKLRLNTKAGTLEIMDTDRPVRDQILRAILYAE